MPKDIQKRKHAMEVITEDQKTLDGHLRELPKKERVIQYSHLTFRRAAVEWLIWTDQAST